MMLSSQDVETCHLHGEHAEASSSSSWWGLPFTSLTEEKQSWASFAGRALLGVVLVVTGGTILVFALSGVLKEGVVPALHWMDSSLSRPMLAGTSMGLLAVLPVVLVPSGPVIWLLGMTFGYWPGVLIAMAGVMAGMTLTFATGHCLLHQPIQAWLKRHPRQGLWVRVADHGNWLHQFRVVVLLRVSPIPYPMLNYIVTISKLRFAPYMAGSFFGILPEIVFGLYCGQVLRSLAESGMERRGHHLDGVQVAYSLAGLAVSAALVVATMVYGGRRLRELEAAEGGGTPEGESERGFQLPVVECSLEKKKRGPWSGEVGTPEADFEPLPLQPWGPPATVHESLSVEDEKGQLVPAPSGVVASS